MKISESLQRLVYLDDEAFDVLTDWDNRVDVFDDVDHMNQIGQTIIIMVITTRIEMLDIYCAIERVHYEKPYWRVMLDSKPKDVERNKPASVKECHYSSIGETIAEALLDAYVQLLQFYESVDGLVNIRPRPTKLDPGLIYEIRKDKWQK